MLALGPNPDTILLQKPARGASINWKDGLTQGLKFYCLIDDAVQAQTLMRDLVTQQRGASLGASDFSVSNVRDLGLSIASITNSTNNQIRWTEPCYSLTSVTSGPVTLAVKLNLLVSDANFKTALGRTQNLTINGYALRVDSASKPILLMNNSAVTGNLALTLGQWVTIFGTWPGNGGTQSIYVFDLKGQLLDQATNVFAGPIVDAAGGNVGLFNMVGDGSSIGCAIEWGAIWLKEMPLTACARLARNPYSILLPPGANVYLPGIFQKPVAAALENAVGSVTAWRPYPQNFAPILAQMAQWRAFDAPVKDNAVGSVNPRVPSGVTRFVYPFASGDNPTDVAPGTTNRTWPYLITLRTSPGSPEPRVATDRAVGSVNRSWSFVSWFKGLFGAPADKFVVVIPADGSVGGANRAWAYTQQFQQPPQANEPTRAQDQAVGSVTSHWSFTSWLNRLFSHKDEPPVRDVAVGSVPDHWLYAQKLPTRSFDLIIGQQVLIQSSPTVNIFHIVGITRDCSGAPLGNCNVYLFRASDFFFAAFTISDAGGNYSFTIFDNTTQWYLIARKPGVPDVAGVTDDNIVGS